MMKLDLLLVLIQKKEKLVNAKLLPDQLKMIIEDSILTCSKELSIISKNESKLISEILVREKLIGREIDYGTTAVMFISDGEEIIISNTGDSRCIMIEGYNKDYENINSRWIWKSEQITRDHNPVIHLDECEGVKKAGGTFHEQNGEKRLYPKHMTYLQAKKKGLAINMTRAIGHQILQDYGLIPNPDLYHIHINPYHHYIFILASDGIWDVMDNDDVCNIVKKCMMNIKIIN